MIDVHCHILPGIDDGPKNVETAITLAHQAVEQGVTHIVCTPHHMNRNWMNPRANVEQYVADFQAVLDREGIPLTLFPGQEIRLHGDLLRNIEKNEICFYDEFSQYLLVEFPTQEIPEYAERLFYELQVEGITPVIAHPERNEAIQKEPQLLVEFVERGVLGQLTAASLNGTLGRSIETFSHQLIEANLVHVIGSDAHHPKRRPFDIGDAFNQLEQAHGEDVMKRFDQTARDLVNGDPISYQIQVSETIEPIKKGFLSWF